MAIINKWVVLVIFILCATPSRHVQAESQVTPATNHWTNSAGGFQWNQAGNWSLGHVPVAGESVIFNDATQATCEVAPRSVAQNLHSLIITSDYQGRIICAVGFAEGHSQILNVTNDVIVNGGTLIFTSKIINTIDGEGVTINAANVIVGSGAVIHADERGFPAQQGPGSSDQFSFGPSAGGRGEDNVSRLEYGDPGAPDLPGSGGSSSTGDASSPGGQAGGGAIQINVGTGTIRIDGQLRANGAPDGFHNSGSGGSLYLVCGTFEGTASGLVQAKGGNISHPGRSPGGGGRVAVKWSNTSTFEGNFDVSGGADSQAHGQPGTLWLPSGSDLTIRTPYKVGLAPGNHSFGAVVVESGAELFCHSSFVGNSTYVGCQVVANSITVDVGGVISADEDGFAPSGAGISSGPGGSVSGGSHGGRGVGGLAAYGDPLNPVTLGSGGSKGSWPGSNTRSPRWGGGALKLVVTGALALNGTLRSNGGYQGGGDKGGAGGSVHIVCDLLSGNGTIQAKGGGGSSGDAGGGRIALEYNTSSFTGSASAAGSGSGEVGSVIPGNLSLGAHAAGQTGDSFQAVDNPGVQLLRFALYPAGNMDDVAFEDVEISKLVFDLSHVSGIVAADITNIRIYADTNGDGLTVDESGPVATIGTAVLIVGDDGTLSLDFAVGSLVLDGTSAATNFIVLADVSNLVVGDALKISLASTNSNVQSIGVDSKKEISKSSSGYAELLGGVSSAIHQMASDDISSYSFLVGLTQTQGNGFSATLTAWDANSNQVDTLVEVMLSSDGGVTFYTDNTFLIPTTTAILENGIATIFLKDELAETVILAATDPAANRGKSSPLMINPSLTISYAFESAPAQTAGTAWQVTLTAVDGPDGTGSRVDSEAIATLTSTGNATFFADAATTQPISSIVLQGGQAFLFVKDEVAELLRLHASDLAGTSGESVDITVAASAIASYAVSGSPFRIKGRGFSETVTALDAFGNIVVTASNSVTLTNTGAARFFEGSNYLTSTNRYVLSGGATSIYVKDDVLETMVLTATDSGLKTGDSPPVTVSFSIQQRIDLATAGDIIVIAPGEYHEHFVVNKPLTITTANPSLPNKPIIDGDGAAYVCEIAASDVVIEGLEFRDSSSHLVFSQGVFEAGGVAHVETFNRVTIRHCIMHDAGGDGVAFRNIFDGNVENCLTWDVNGNGIFMDGVGNAVVKNNEIKGVGNMVRGILINWCYPATIENNYIHDLYDAESALYFTGNWSGTYSIRNNVIVNNKLRDMVSWHPYGGSALAIRKPTQDGTTALIFVEHNTIVGNSGVGPRGVTGHGIAWDWNGVSNLTVDITNNLMHGNSGKSFTTRLDSVDFGNSPNGVFDYNDCTDGIQHTFFDYTMGNNNIGAPPAFISSSGANGKYRFELDVCPAQRAASDGRDMGAMFTDPSGIQENNYQVEIILGASINDADDFIDVGSFLSASIRISALNPWVVHPASVRVFLGYTSLGVGVIELWDSNAATQVTFVDVLLDVSGSGSSSFKVKGMIASGADNDIIVQASYDINGQGNYARQDLTVLTPATYTLVSTSFRVEDSEGNLITEPAFIEVDGLGTVANADTLIIRDGTAITYRVLVDYGPAYGGRKVAGNSYSGIVTTTTNVFVGEVDEVELKAQDQNGLEVEDVFVQLQDQQGRGSGFIPVGSKILLPVPGIYTPVGKIGNIQSHGRDVPNVLLRSGVGPHELIAPFRVLDVVAKDQNLFSYTDAIVMLGRGSTMIEGGSGYVVTLPVGGTVEVSSQRFGFSGSTDEIVVGAADTELIADLRRVFITVKDATTQLEVPSAAWKLLFKGFEKAYGLAGDAGDTLSMPVGSTPVLEGFLWNASQRVTPVIDGGLGNIEIQIDQTELNPVKITSPNWSFFSNGFFEGTRDNSCNSVSIEIAGNSSRAATLLGNTHWYGYLPLNSAQAVTVRATATNKYGQSATVDLPDVSWQKTFIGDDSAKIIPVGSQLLLTSDASDVTGADTVDIVFGDGQAAVRIAMGEFAVVSYPSAGQFLAEARILDLNENIIETRSIHVAALEVTSSSKSFASQLDRTRSIFWDVVPSVFRSSVSVNAEDVTLLNVTNQRDHGDVLNFPNRSLVDVRAYQPSGPVGSAEGGGSAPFADLDFEQQKELLTSLKDGYFLRVGSADGWIPKGIHVDVDEFKMFSEGDVATIFTLIEDGSYIGNLGLRMIPRIPDLDGEVVAIGGSVTTFDGSRKYLFNSDSMDEDGYIEIPTEQMTAGNVCHTWDLFQTNSPKVLIGTLGKNGGTIYIAGGLFSAAEDYAEIDLTALKKPLWTPQQRYFAITGKNAEVKLLEVQTDVLAGEAGELMGGSAGIPHKHKKKGALPAKDKGGHNKSFRFFTPDGKKHDVNWPSNGFFDLNECYDKTHKKENVEICTGILPSSYDVTATAKGGLTPIVKTLPDFIKIVRVDIDGWTGKGDTSTIDPLLPYIVAHSKCFSGSSNGTQFQVSLRGTTGAGKRAGLTVSVHLTVQGTDNKLRFSDTEKSQKYVALDFDLTTDANGFGSRTFFLHALGASVKVGDSRIVVDVLEKHAVCPPKGKGLVWEDEWLGAADVEKITAVEFTDASIKVTAQTNYSLNGGWIKPEGLVVKRPAGEAASKAFVNQAVIIEAFANIKPVGADLKIKQLENLRVAIMQETLSTERTATWSNPQIKWKNNVGDAFVVASKTHHAFVEMDPLPVNDGNPFTPKVPIFTRGVRSVVRFGQTAREVDSPKQPRVSTLKFDARDSTSNVVVGKITYSLSEWKLEDHFRTYCVIYDTKTREYCALRETEWNTGVDNLNAPKKASAGKKDKVAINRPTPPPPKANAAVRARTLPSIVTTVFKHKKNP